MHVIPVGEPYRTHWRFDGNLDAPTFAPSVKISYGDLSEAEAREWGVVRCCHYFIRNGRIQFCGDSTHALAGKTVPLPPLPNAPQQDEAQTSGGDNGHEN